MDIVDFILFLAKNESKGEYHMKGKTNKRYEINCENEESSLSTEKSIRFGDYERPDNNISEKFLETLMNENNINYSNLINKILLPISKKIIGLIGDFTLAYSRLKDVVRKKEIEEKRKIFAKKNIIISPPITKSA